MIFTNWIPKAYAAAASSETSLLAGQTGAKGLKIFSNVIFSNIDNWIAGLLIIIGFVVLAQKAGAGARNAMLRSKGEEVQENALILVERMTKIVIIFIGITIALAINGLNFTAVIGAISLGIGFALKEFIQNFISSVVMLSQNRIRIGDLVDINGILGRIISIDTRTTMIQQLDGSMVTIPNQTMLSSMWKSYSASPFRRVELIVGVGYSTDMKACANLIRAIIAKNPDIAVKPEPSILIDEFSDSAIQLKIWFWVENSKPFLKIRSNLAHKIKKAFDKVGINIPFPIRTLKLDEDDRAFLKTMDSLKKGVIPETKPAPTQEEIIEEALEVQKEPPIPVNLFEQEKQKPPAPAPIAPPSSIKTAAAPAVIPTKTPPPTRIPQ